MVKRGSPGGKRRQGGYSISVGENTTLVQPAYEQIFNQGGIDLIEKFGFAELVDHDAPPHGMEGLEASRSSDSLSRCSAMPFPTYNIWSKT
jgi:hypothetical protein